MLHIEKDIIETIIHECEAAGFQLHGVNEGEELVLTATPDEALEVIGSVEISTLVFTRGARRYGVLLVMGNGEDVACDHTDDNGPFVAAIDQALRACSVI